MARRRRRSDIGEISASARKSRLRLQKETLEQKEARLIRARNNQRQRLQNETLAEREERLAKSRWLHARKRRAESYATRQRRLEKNRVQLALKKSQMKEAAERTNYLMQTEHTFETVITRQIRDQLHETRRRVLRLSVTNVKHTDISPNSFDKISNTEALCETSLPMYSCPMDDGLNSEDESIFEPKVVVSELNYPSDIEPLVKIETEGDESDDPEMLIGDHHVLSNPEYTTCEPDIKCESDHELTTGDITPHPELMISQTEINAKSQRIDNEYSCTEVKCEIDIKSEVCTEKA